jgi:hypothetical protein
MAKRGRKQLGGEFSDFDRWRVCNLARCRHKRDFSGSEMDLCPPLRIRSPTMAQAQTTTKASQCRYRAPAREAVEASADKAQDLDASDRFRPQGIRPRDRRVTASPASSLTP